MAQAHHHAYLNYMRPALQSRYPERNGSPAQLSGPPDPLLSIQGPLPLKADFTAGALLHTACDLHTASFPACAGAIACRQVRDSADKQCTVGSGCTLPHGARYFLIMVSRSMIPAGTAGSVAACAQQQHSVAT